MAFKEIFDDDNADNQTGDESGDGFESEPDDVGGSDEDDGSDVESDKASH